MIHIPRLFPAVALLISVLILGACTSSTTPKDPMDAMRVLLPGRTALSGLTLKDTAVVYERNTVWDYLGQYAETYLNNGFDKLSTGTYVSADNSKSLKVDIMLFQEPINAFTMYAWRRNPAGKFLDLPEDAYILGDTLAFLNGKYVGKIQRNGNVADDDLLKTAKLIIDKFTDTLSALPRQLDAFPAEGKVAHSELKLPRTQDRFDETPEFFGCQYLVNADTITLYFMLNSQIGISIATESFLGKEGKIDEWLMEGQYQSLTGTHPENGPVFCAQQGGTLAVVTGYSDSQNARALVEQFFQSIPK